MLGGIIVVIARNNENINKSTKAYNFIKNKILNNEFDKGEVISENQIAKMLGTSRTPVRSAFQKLASEKLIKIMPSRGALIKDMSLKEAKDIYDLRIALETFALKKIFHKISGKDIHDLEKLIEKEKKYFRNKDEESCMKSMRMDMKFHFYFVELYGNKEMERLINNFEERFTVYGYIALKKPGRITSTLKEHREIVNAIKNNDLEDTLNKLKFHLENGKKHILLE